MKWVHRFLNHFAWYRYFVEWTKTVYLPGFRPLPLHTVSVFFFKEIQQESLANKASTLAFNFMLALFPATIFLFTLIPYIPISHFQDNLLQLLRVILPSNTYLALRGTLDDMVKHQNGKLLSFGFVSALYFAANGVYTLMRAFNKSSLITETRSWVKRRSISLLLTVMISFAFMLAISVLIAGLRLLKFFKSKVFSHGSFWAVLVTMSRWLVVIAIFYVTVSILYRYGPAHKRRWKFSSPGSILATTLAVITSLGFSYYINHFSSYNKIYGSIGTLIVMMLWLYLNSFIILIGFELNASIDLSKRSVKVERPKTNAFRANTKI
ncbi:YihY/virulence factor BrkB family protein [Mucilaginibacter koreensis]